MIKSPLVPVTDAFLKPLRGAMGDVFSDLPAAYLEEPRGISAGLGGVLARPRTVQEVSQIVVACAQAGVGIVPYGGGTGLVGAQIYPQGPAPVILSLERMAAVRSVDLAGNTITVEAGMTLADVQGAAEAAGRLFPLALASQGSCRIGGNLSTNAGGVQVLRYGNTRDLCLGVEAVLPDGSIHHGLKRLRKDNTGYDIRNLLVGAEGTLGVITAAVLKLYPRPVVQATSFSVVRDPAAAVALLGRIQGALDGLVSAFELIHGTGFAFLSETMPEVRLPFEGAPEWMVLAEVGGSAASGLEARMMEVLGRALEDGLISDVVLAQNGAQRDAFWAVRESIPAANKRVGAISSHDISVPIDGITAFISEGAAKLAEIGPVRLNCFGHLGDGNLHFNVYPPKGGAKADWVHLREDVVRCVYDLVEEYEGSISAEHGIGRFKVDELQRYGDAGKLAAMRAIKEALDPLGIMNPGAVLARL